MQNALKDHIPNIELVQGKGSFKTKDIESSDFISSVSFNHDGSQLAIGDKGGRVKSRPNSDEYSLYSTFQSHDPDFDYLKSVEIEERINKIAWLPQHQHSHHLLTTNGLIKLFTDKTVKLFRINDNCFLKEPGDLLTLTKSNDLQQPNGLRFRRENSILAHPIRQAKCLRVFSDAHHFNIHSISGCCDPQLFISCDDLRINLWSLNRNDTCFTIVDLKPERMEFLSEIITTAVYHPTEPDIFAYTTSKGAIKLCDSRINAICDIPAIEKFKELSMPSFSEALLSISSLRFASNPRYFLTRNYLEVSVWDCNMNKGPIETYLVQGYLNSRERLNDMYEQDCLFDKFDACFSQNNNYIFTGTYGDHFSLTNRKRIDGVPETFFFSADPSTLRNRNEKFVFEPRLITEEHIFSPNQIQHVKSDFLDYQQRINILDCHPNDNIIALAVNDNIVLVETSPKK